MKHFDKTWVAMTLVTALSATSGAQAAGSTGAPTTPGGNTVSTKSQHDTSYGSQDVTEAGVGVGAGTSATRNSPAAGRVGSSKTNGLNKGTNSGANSDVNNPVRGPRQSGD